MRAARPGGSGDAVRPRAKPGGSGDAVRPPPKLSRLPRDLRGALAAARRVARCRGARLYLAGGVVRDLLTGAPVRDVDLVVDADADGFARELARELSADVRAHARFGTAVLTLPGGRRLDVAAARRESYAAPGELPEVAFPATIEEDLARRDFTVNALALELEPRRRLVDPHGGRADLTRKTLRALHAGSFRDDPTRALRAVRYANRYGFRLERATRRDILGAVRAGAFDRVSGDRLRRELAKILAEPRRAQAVRRLRALRLDAAVTPPLARTRGSAARLRDAEGLADADLGWVAFLLAWADGLNGRALRRVADRLGIVGRDRERLLAWPRTRRRLRRGLARLAPSALARRTRGLSREELVAAAAGLGGADRAALVRAPTSPGERLPIRGADLLAAGIPPGAAIGRALSRTRDAVLDGRIAPAQALAFAVRAARRERS